MRTIEEYLELPYTIEILKEVDDDYSGWVGRVVELPGCITQADSFEELGEMIQDAMHAWIEAALEDGYPIAEPRPFEDYSGKFVVRVPKSLHRELVEFAEKDGVSLNAYINMALGKNIGTQFPTKQEMSSDISTSLINWPRISDRAKSILIAYGMDEEVKDIDEQLFAGWIDEHIHQIQTAIDEGYYKEAREYLNNIYHALKMLGDTSPIIATYSQVLNMLDSQFDMVHRLKEGIGQTFLKERINATSRKSIIRLHTYELSTKFPPEVMDLKNLFGRIPHGVEEDDLNLNVRINQEGMKKDR
jgi:antitoxin HicB